MGNIDQLKRWVGEHDEQALADLVAACIQRVYSIAVFVVEQPQDAEEVVQDVFTVLIRKAPQVLDTIPERSDECFLGWLCRTASLTALNYRKSKKFHDKVFRELTEDDMRYASAPDPESESVWKEIAPLLPDALAGLKEKYRAPVTLRYIMGMSVKEVAQALHVSVDCAQKRIGRALQFLETFFRLRGKVLSPGALVAGLSAYTAQAVPVGLATKIAAGAIAQAALPAGVLPAAVQATLAGLRWMRLRTLALRGAVAVSTAGVALLTVTQLGFLPSPESAVPLAPQTQPPTAVQSVRMIASGAAPAQQVTATSDAENTRLLVPPAVTSGTGTALSASEQAPWIIEQPPADQHIVQGFNALFAVTADGTPPLFHQWFFKGQEILGATNSTLALTNVQFSNVGDYSVVITNAYGSVTSTLAHLTVRMLPLLKWARITAQPEGQTAVAGGDVLLTVTAAGESPLFYQWRKDGRNIVGATNATFVLTNVQISDAGFYLVRVTNLWNSVTSAPAHLVVKMMPPGNISPPNLRTNTAPSTPRGIRLVPAGNAR